jgi:hypothetical protein
MSALHFLYACGTRIDQNRSKIDGNAFAFPIAKPHGFWPVSASQFFWKGEFTICLTPCLGFGQGTFRGIGQVL